MMIESGSHTPGDREVNVQGYSIGIDVGGTFTDVVVAGPEGSQVFKVSSTPRDIGRAVVNGLERVHDALGIPVETLSRIVHGTTVATNALLEGKGAPVGLITNAGFEDVLEIGRQNRSSLPVPHAVYNLQLERPPQLVPRRYRLGVRGRLSFNGGELEPLHEDDVRKACRFLVESDIGSIAVCLLYSYADPGHERRVRAILEDELHRLWGSPGSSPCAESPVYITLSSDILPEYREYERTSTTVISAMLKPVMHGYLARLDDRIREVGAVAPLEVMQSAGGIMRADAAGERAIYTLLSGPAAGVRGAQYAVAARQALHGNNLITLDMGGTSTDLSLVSGGNASITVENAPGGYPVRIPMLDIHAIGQGGGSLVSVDSAGGLRVGPGSAGADPGPVCYGRGGTQPTVTDAQLVLGRLNPARALAGEVQLDRQAAYDAFAETVARPLGLAVEEAAEGVIDVVVANMKRAVQVISIEKGYDPREFTLVAFGGAGPLHAPLLARTMDIPRVIVPTNSGVLSALGLLTVDLTEYHVQSILRPCSQVTAGELTGAFAGLEKEAAALFVSQGHDAASLGYSRFVDLRYLGQSYELIVPVGDSLNLANLEEKFHREHRRVYGHASPSEPVELVNVRLMTTAPVHKPPLSPAARQRGHGKHHYRSGSAPQSTVRPVFIGRRWVDTPVYVRQDFPTGFALTGPAVIEEEICTTFVPPGARLTVDDYANLVIETGGEPS